MTLHEVLYRVQVQAEWKEGERLAGNCSIDGSSRFPYFQHISATVL